MASTATELSCLWPQRLPKARGHARSELLGQNVHGVERQVPFTPFDPGKVAGCHLELLCALFLREPPGQANGAELLSERRLECLRCHVVSRLSPWTAAPS